MEQRGDPPRHGLGRARRYLGIRTIHYEDVAGKGAKQIPFSQVPVDKAAEYSAEDADVTLRLHQVLWPQIAAVPALKTLYEEIEQPLVPVLLRMEEHGVLLDRQMLRTQSGELAKRLMEVLGEAHKEAGAPFNLDSPKQLCNILFEKMQLPVVRKTPTGQPSTAEDVLEELAESYRLPKLILEYRSLSKLKSTYTDKLPEQINAQTGRVHTSYHQAVAATGPPVFAGSEPAEHSDPHARGPAHPPGLHRAARATCCWRRTTRRSSCASWRTCPATTGCCSAFAERPRHSPGHRRRSVRHAARSR